MLRFRLITCLVVFCLINSIENVPWGKKRGSSGIDDLLEFHANILKGILKGNALLESEIHEAMADATQNYDQSEQDREQIKKLKIRITSILKLVSKSLEQIEATGEKFTHMMYVKNETFSLEVRGDIEKLSESLDISAQEILKEHPESADVSVCVNAIVKNAKKTLAATARDIDECTSREVNRALKTLGGQSKYTEIAKDLLVQSPLQMEACETKENLADIDNCLDDLVDEIGSTTFPMFSEMGRVILEGGSDVLISNGYLAGCAGPELAQLAYSITEDIVAIGQCSYEAKKKRK